MIKLIKGDCLEQMKAMPDKCVNMIFTSPPYNMNLRVLKGKYVSRCRNKNHSKEFSTKYENYNDDLPMEDYYQFQREFISEALRISDLLFYNIQLITGNKVALLKLMGLFADKIKDIIIWDKVNGQPAMHTGVMNSRYEFIIVFASEKAYNRQFDICNFERGTFDNVLRIKTEKNTNNKAAFPLELAKIIISNFSKEKDVILDAFMGSGTTGIACRQLDRDFIGIEIDERQFNIAKQRIETQVHQTQLL